jgi:hypothetical protein
MKGKNRNGDMSLLAAASQLTHLPLNDWNCPQKCHAQAALAGMTSRFAIRHEDATAKM